jgi:DNA-binding CsgD family transcriptional regulator
MLAERVAVVPYGWAIRSRDEVLRLRAYALRAVVAVVPAAAAFVRVTWRGRVEDAVALGSRDDPVPWDRLRALDPAAASSGATVLPVDVPAAHGLAMYLRSAGTVVAAIVLARGERFTREEASGLRRIQPLVEHAYLCATEPRSKPAREALRRWGLTAREAEVAALAGRGATNAEIARSLHMSEATVKTHLVRAYAKAGVRSRTQLVVMMGGDGDA